ncbi:GFA family protein [Klebsiella aerogenes]|uniref:GFA family protein n=1 Tax=Klebsiella aerogenes TaxID=548 RepID=UPI0005758E00|nr:GFA family protein [Klebsiella aerogenes]KHM32867.1 aldehyde-activating protein [Klebsiella aerogenes]
MDEIKYLIGKCLCGSVSVKIKHLTNKVGICHCQMCRRWHGGPQFAINGGNDIEFKNEENIRIYNSSSWAQRGFCKECGSHLFYKLRESGRYVLMVGLFDDINDFVLDHQFFIDKKPHYYSLNEKTNNLTEEDFMKKFNPNT